jgi:hypothetical protein
MGCNSGQYTTWYSSATTSLSSIRRSVGIGGRSIEDDVISNLDVEDVQETEHLKGLDSKCDEQSHSLRSKYKKYSPSKRKGIN